MKFWKHTFVAVAAFLAIGSAVVYTSCEKDRCLDVKCTNGGACTDGFCSCPTGFEGVLCEEFTASKFLGSFYGETRCVQDTTEFPYIIDTVDLYLKDSSTLTMVQHSHLADTFFGNVLPVDINTGVATRYMIIADDSSLNYIKKFTVELHENKRLTLYTSTTTDVQNGIKTDCKFMGYRKGDQPAQ
jgi:hypothetical protein